MVEIPWYHTRVVVGSSLVFPGNQYRHHHHRPCEGEAELAAGTTRGSGIQGWESRGSGRGCPDWARERRVRESNVGREEVAEALGWGWQACLVSLATRTILAPQIVSSGAARCVRRIQCFLGGSRCRIGQTRSTMARCNSSGGRGWWSCNDRTRTRPVATRAPRKLA
jgi:hypothetical protein